MLDMQITHAKEEDRMITTIREATFAIGQFSTVDNAIRVIENLSLGKPLPLADLPDSLIVGRDLTGERFKEKYAEIVEVRSEAMYGFGVIAKGEKFIAIANFSPVTIHTLWLEDEEEIRGALEAIWKCNDPFERRRKKLAMKAFLTDRGQAVVETIAGGHDDEPLRDVALEMLDVLYEQKS